MGGDHAMRWLMQNGLPLRGERDMWMKAVLRELTERGNEGGKKSGRSSEAFVQSLAEDGKEKGRPALIADLPF
ncbi:MAG: hypothetical protein ACXWNQ_08715 [Anaerolineales bacterium]